MTTTTARRATATSDPTGADDGGREELPVLEARHVSKHFKVRGGALFGPRRVVHAVDDVSIALFSGRITALVGESGSGKSTLARLLAHLHPLTDGEVLYRGKPVDVRRGRSFREYTSRVQLILQDPFGSFNPVARVAKTLRRAVRIHHRGARRTEIDRIIEGLMSRVNLTPAAQFTEKFPHELSGGQLQRVSIARALAASPDVFLADEPVSSLDVSIRLGILNLLRQLTLEREVALLYVTHDIASARYFAQDTAVMYAGELIEQGPSEAVTQEAAHPYTQLLIASAPDPSRPDGERISDIGQPPSLVDPPAGCRFHPRCPFAMERCRSQRPETFELSPGHTARCWLYADDPEASERRARNRESRGLTPPVTEDGVARPAPRAQHTEKPDTKEQDQ